MPDNYEIKKTVDPDGTERVEVIMKSTPKKSKKVVSNPNKDA